MSLLALLALAAAPADATAARYGFAGEILTVRGARVDDRAYGDARPGARWPLGAIRAQVAAVLAVRTPGASSDWAGGAKRLPGDFAVDAQGVATTTAFGLLTFDSALLRGALLTAPQRESLLAGEVVALSGCAAPVRVVAAGDETARNYLLPGGGGVLILFRGEGGPPLGAPDRPGLVRDLLAAIACPETAG